MDLLTRLKNEILILDGSMGALLQQRNLPAGYAPDLWNLENPDAIRGVHEEYIKAGSDIILTNTFGASRIRLGEYKAESKIREINHAAVQIARKAATVVDRQIYVAGDIGPCGALVEPAGDFSFEEAVEVFKEQIQALVEAGVDLLMIETIFDIQEMRAAVIAANQVRGKIPLIANGTFTQGGLMDTGTDVESMAAIMEGLGVDGIGVNCSTGPEDMLKVVQTFGEVSNAILAVQPNAGLPININGKTVFPATPDSMAPFGEKFVKAGANIIGGCCGTTPDYIRLLRAAVKPLKPVPKTYRPQLRIASRTKTLYIGSGYPFMKIGEKINPTGRKAFGEAIKEGRVDLIVAEALKEAQSGAHALDVNVGVPMTDEAGMMRQAVRAIVSSVDLPLVIDSSYNNALEAGLVAYPGKALINSVNAEPEKMEAVLPLVKKYGAAVLALTAGTEVPLTAEKRLKQAKVILKEAEQHGIARENLLFDCLALTVSAMQEGSRETLRTIQMIKAELGIPTVVGLSNVSFGLPQRKLVHNTFLAQAIASGLDSAIVNPYDPEMHTAVAAASLFAGRDKDCKQYIEYASTLEPVKTEGAAQPAEAKKALTPAEKIYEAVLEGQRENIAALCEEGVASGLDPFGIFVDTMTPAIRKLGDLFGERKKFIPHLIASAETMKRGVDVLLPHIEKSRAMESKGTIIFATVKGDIHDIGKNICAIMLKNFGFNVIDLGRNVPAEEIIAAAKVHKADLIGLSALMTTTMMQMQTVVEEARKENLSAKIWCGGAVVTPQFVKEIGADGYSKDVGDVVSVVEGLMAEVKK